MWFVSELVKLNSGLPVLFKVALIDIDGNKHIIAQYEHRWRILVIFTGSKSGKSKLIMNFMHNAMVKTT